MALSFSCTASLYSQQQHQTFPKDHGTRHQCRRIIQTLVQTSVIPSISSSPPQESLRRGNWVKLICGASFEDVVDVRNLSLIYTLAGVDCIDCAADESVVNAVNEGIDAARGITPLRRPWVMISINDDEDLHFRKAEFDPEDCPPDCLRPCEMVCPANAISLESISMEEVSPHGAGADAGARGKFQQGVITERCYGCGRCLPVCPYDKISAITYVRDAASTSQLLMRNDVDAVEIHTSARHIDSFNELWKGLAESIGHVKLVAVSLPDVGNSTIFSMNLMYSIMHPHLQCYNLWQLDGRPMSGDIGRGATREAIAFAVRLAASTDRPPGFLQLAGGTNAHTIDYLKKVGLFQNMSIPEHSRAELCAAKLSASLQALIGGVAYGGYARKIAGRVLRKMQSQHSIACVEDYPEYLLEALREAVNLVGPVKCYNLPSHLP
ncbi:uncharacterized protein LOC131225376 isoform X2 [Magnolia sinica]|uniref:uncharacterized protein LOC131225376 isoform X2 n=1 Tax=Magnolia sinica TaxID=86752 RepID=UPI00265A02DC|nr:uncharacterized protein LOC131225376 isoform X2 [Magnolia sinica]